VRYVVLKEIAHRVHEDSLGLAPSKWLKQLFWHESEVEALLVGVTGNSPPSLSKRLGVAMLAARTDLVTTPDGVPCGVGPFDIAET
jgi:hypothetical protein